MSRSKWKGPNRYPKITLENSNNLRFKRSSDITPQDVGKTVLVHNGKAFMELVITSGMTAFKAGGFISTRSQFVFKKKK